MISDPVDIIYCEVKVTIVSTDMATSCAAPIRLRVCELPHQRGVARCE